MTHYLVQCPGQPWQQEWSPSISPTLLSHSHSHLYLKIFHFLPSWWLSVQYRGPPSLIRAMSKIFLAHHIVIIFTEIQLITQNTLRRHDSEWLPEFYWASVPALAERFPLCKAGAGLYTVLCCQNKPTVWTVGKFFWTVVLHTCCELPHRHSI